MFRQIRLPILASVVVAMGMAMMVTNVQAERVTLRVKEGQSGVTDRTVHIGDIATLEGGSTTDRRLMSQLDLDSVVDGQPCLISQRQINTRLLLAGFSRQDFQIIGPAVAQAISTSPDHQSKMITNILAAQLGSQFGIDAKRISIRLDNATQVDSFINQFDISSDAIKLAPRNDFPIGRTRLQMQCAQKSSTQSRLPHQVWLDVTVGLSMRVAVASEPVTRGATITDQMIQVVERTISSRADYVDADSVAGKTASRYVPPGTILLASHLIASRQSSTPVVKRNDVIDVVIRAGAGEIRLKNARAMEPGHPGDTIEILNPKSGKRFNAEVVSANLATIAPTGQRRLVR
ncbi:flagellar basal body P-ring formation chaperone FlgA [Stieleria sp. JC731]|nr:flagellar basal body P-ring formation chaperone FlgA [Stieleria sp. JC731]